MKQKTEASQTVDERAEFVQVYLQEYPGGNAYDAEIAYGGYAGTMWLAAKRAALKAQPAPTDVPAAYLTSDRKMMVFADKLEGVYMDGMIPLYEGSPPTEAAQGALSANPNLTTSGVTCQPVAAQGNTSNNSSSSQLSGNSGELANKQVLENIEQVQGEDSARLDALEKLRDIAGRLGEVGRWETAGSIHEAVDVLADIDHARASAETGGVKS